MDQEATPTKIQQLKGFLLATPNDSFLKHALALEYIKSNELENARKYFEEIIANDASYVGTYYHLAKLYEQLNEKEKAMIVYENGMIEAKKKQDRHAYNELLSAYEELIDL